MVCGLDDGNVFERRAVADARHRRRRGITLFPAYVKYKFGDDYGYGAYKTLLSGGALLAGLLMIALASPSARLAAPRRLAAAGLLRGGVGAGRRADGAPGTSATGARGSARPTMP